MNGRHPQIFDEQLLMTSKWASFVLDRFEQPVPAGIRGSTFYVSGRRNGVNKKGDYVERRNDDIVDTTHASSIVVKYTPFQYEASRYEQFAPFFVCPRLLCCTPVEGGLELELERAQGNLSQFFPKTENEKIRAIQEITALVELLERNEVSHCDIKPSNILVANDATCSGQRYLLGDFGSSKTFEEYRQLLRNVFGMTNNEITLLGTRGYIPPEQYRGKNHFRDKPADAIPVRHDSFSIGMLFMYLQTEVFPHIFLGNTHRNARNSLLSGDYRKIIMSVLPDAAGKFVKEFIFAAIEYIPYNRPTVAELKALADGL